MTMYLDTYTTILFVRRIFCWSSSSLTIFSSFIFVVYFIHTRTSCPAKSGFTFSLYFIYWKFEIDILLAWFLLDFFVHTFCLAPKSFNEMNHKLMIFWLCISSTGMLWMQLTVIIFASPAVNFMTS